MPSGGRINRRDNLRSKTVKAKTKDKDSHVKQSNFLKTASGVLDIAKSKSSKLNTASDNKIDINESEVISKGLRKFYVCLEDIKLNDQKSVINTDMDKDKSEKLTVKEKTNDLLKVESINKLIESPQKNDEIAVENLYDTLKRKGRNTKMNDTDNFKAPVVEKVDKLETNVLKIEKRGRKKKKEEIIDDSANQTDLLNTNLSDNEKVDNKIELNKASPIKKSIKKLVRRNVLPQTQEKKVDIQLIVEKMEIDDESKSEKSSTDINLDVDNNNSRARRNKTTRKVENKPETIEEVEEEKPSTVQRTRSRIQKGKKQFVIENEQTNEKETKVPGLTMLANMKNRKSQMIKNNEEVMNKKTIEMPEKIQIKSKELTENIEDSSLKNPGLKMLSDLKKRNSELIGPSKRESHEFIKPNLCQPILPKVSDNKSNQSKDSDNKSGIDNLSPMVSIKPVIVHPVTPIPPRQTAGRKSKLTPMVSDKVPGLSITEDLKKRKSEIISEQNNNARKRETNEKKKPREIAPKIATDSSVLPITPIAARQNAARKSKLVSDKVPGLKDTESIMKRKSELIPEPSPAKIAPKPVGSSTILAAPTTSLARGTIHSPVPFNARKSVLVPGSNEEIDKSKLIKTPQKSPTLDFNFLTSPYRPPIEHPDNYMDLFDRDIPTTPAKLNPPSMDSSANIRFMSMKSPIGILSKPSPFKRPISMLDASDDDNSNDGSGNHEEEFNSRCKMPKIQIENRRQSVTFNREVSVKEIHGNSFNSVKSDEAGGSGDEHENDFEHRLNAELERVKHKVNEKHNTSFATTGTAGTLHSNEFLKDRQRMIGPSAFNRNDSKKSSDLSGMISNRIKIQSNSPPRELNERSQIRPKDVAFNFDQSRSGALKKVNQPAASHQKDFPSNWRSFNPVPQQPSKFDNDDDDNSMDVDEKDDEASKSKCSIM